MSNSRKSFVYCQLSFTFAFESTQSKLLKVRETLVGRRRGLLLSQGSQIRGLMLIFGRLAVTGYLRPDLKKI